MTATNTASDRRVNKTSNGHPRRFDLPTITPALPSIFTLELTTFCDNRCSGCANVELTQQRETQQKHSRTMGNWQEIIDTVVKQGGKKTIIRLSGGEPTLHPEFSDIVRYLDTQNVPHALLTTGRWQKIGSENLIELYKSCENFVGFLISLHGADAQTHNSFVESGEKSFQETTQNIQKARQNGLRVYTNTVLTHLNYTQIEEIQQLSKQLGAQYAVFNRFIADEHPLQTTEEQLLEAIKTVQILRGRGEACRVGNTVPTCFFPLTNFPSVSGYELCHISPNGNIRPDNLTVHSFGNILMQPLKDIWQSSKAQSYRYHFPDSCLQCAAFSTCRGGSKSLNFSTLCMGDTLMKYALSLEQTLFIDDDKEKKKIENLALTSD